jgi:hypothetical protein
MLFSFFIETCGRLFDHQSSVEKLTFMRCEIDRILSLIDPGSDFGGTEMDAEAESVLSKGMYRPSVSGWFRGQDT